MSRAAGILARVNSVMPKVAPLTRTAYKRTVIQTGGNALIGRAGAVTNTDTILDPQPVVVQMARKRISGGKDRVQPVMLAAGQRTADDYKFLFSPDALSLAELQSRNLCLVLKDSAGMEEVLFIKDFEPIGLNGTIVAINVFVESVKQQ